MPRRLSAFMGGTRRGRPVVFVGPGFAPHSPRFFGGCGHFESLRLFGRPRFL
jgi:hypothetical protein